MGVEVATAVGTITNDDNNSKLSISDATADEPGTMKFTVTVAAGEQGVAIERPNWATRRRDGERRAPTTPRAAAPSTSLPGRCRRRSTSPSSGDQTNKRGERDAEGRPLWRGRDSGGQSCSTAGANGTLGADKNAPPSLSISDTTAREGQGRNVHRHARWHNAQDGHGRLQHRRRNCEGGLRLRRPRRAHSRSRRARRRRRSPSRCSTTRPPSRSRSSPSASATR